jgi:glutathione peroxidase
MKNLTLLLLFTFASFSFMTPPISTQSIHKFTIKTIDGKSLNLATCKGKKILIVNTASACGYTSQYEGLEKLYKANLNKLVVIGFPCNQFGGQESGSESEIATFCKKNYGVSFPLSSKINVKGANANEVYKWLCSKASNGVLDAEIKWNFNKFLLDENGKMLGYFESSVAPDSQEILKFLK